MDLRLLYSDFVMNDQGVVFHSTSDSPPSLRDDLDNTYCAVAAFQHADPDLARDPLSTNRRLHDTSDLEMLGTLVVAGPTPDQIFVLIPVSVGPIVDAESPVDIQHAVGLSLGSATDLISTLPSNGLHLALCDNSIKPTLGLGRKDYWTEITPIFRQWPTVNDASCPSCHRVIRVNMARHLRASHTQCQCFWRCPVTTCPMWFSSELNGKDHLERIHSFREGLGYSFYDCLRRFGLEWFGRRTFFEEREVTCQALWMDLSLARRSGQELRNNYAITNSPALAPLRRFFRAAVRNLVEAYEDLASSRMTPVTSPSICDQMRQDITSYTPDSIHLPVTDTVVDIPVVESLSPLIISSASPWPVEETPTRSITPNNRSLTYLQTGPFDPPHCHVPLTWGAVSSVSIASTDLLYYVEPVPLNQLLCHSALTVQSWPTVAREDFWPSPIMIWRWPVEMWRI